MMPLGLDNLVLIDDEVNIVCYLYFLILINVEVNFRTIFSFPILLLLMLHIYLQHSVLLTICFSDSAEGFRDRSTRRWWGEHCKEGVGGALILILLMRMMVH